MNRYRLKPGKHPLVNSRYLEVEVRFKMLVFKKHFFFVFGSEKNYFETLRYQPIFNGSNTFGTITICSRQGQFELLCANHIARSGGIIGIFFQFSFR